MKHSPKNALPFKSDTPNKLDNTEMLEELQDPIFISYQSSNFLLNDEFRDSSIEALAKAHVRDIKEGRYSWKQFLSEGKRPLYCFKSDLYNKKCQWIASQSPFLASMGFWKKTDQAVMAFSIQKSIAQEDKEALAHLLDKEILPYVEEIAFSDGQFYKPFKIIEKNLSENGVFLVGLQFDKGQWLWMIEKTVLGRSHIEIEGTSILSLLNYLAENLYCS